MNFDFFADGRFAATPFFTNGSFSASSSSERVILIYFFAINKVDVGEEGLLVGEGGRI